MRHTTTRTRTDASRILRPLGILPALVLAGLLLVPAGIGAQEHDHEHEEAHEHAEEEGHTHADGHGHGLHFSHPMITESVSPDTKFRIDYSYLDFGVDGNESDAFVEAEYAFHSSFSIEAILPYTFNDAAFGNASLVFKLANYAFEDAGVLLGYGLEMEFPTNGEADHPEPAASTADACGSERICVSANRSDVPGPSLHSAGGVGGTLGTETYTASPFLNIGLQTGPWELVGFGIFGIPFNNPDQDHVATNLTYNFSALYKVSSDVQTMLELNGRGGISGESVGQDVVYLSPGLKVRPFGGDNLFAGASVSFPVTNDQEFDTRFGVSLFYHIY